MRATMNLPEEFQGHHDECLRMAKSTRDPETKAMWQGMADRWRRCAELAQTREAAAHQASRELSRKRRRPDRWATEHSSA